MKNRLCWTLQLVAAALVASGSAFAGVPTATPEPSTILLIGGGLAVVFGVRQYRNRKL